MLLQIGEFARLVELSVRNVRYYADLGLLPPTEIDPTTGYRRYGIDQVDRALQLIALKELGLSLDEIALVLDDQLSEQQFRDLLAARVADLETDAHRLQQRLTQAKHRLAELDRRLESPMPEVTIKQTERKTVAYVRDQIGGIAEISGLFPRLFAGVDPSAGVGPAGQIYHYFADDGSSIDVEAVLPVPAGFDASSGEVEVRVVDPVTVASLTHRGAFNRLHEAHGTLLEWVEANGYKVAGPAYEWNIVCTPPVTQDNESYITDVEVEVEQA